MYKGRGKDMKIKDLMTKNPAIATPDMELSRVAKLMVEHNVGSIPVVENNMSMKIVGVVTDRDIATRAVAKGKNPVTMKASEVMSSPVITAGEEDDIKDVAKMMEKNQVRRVPVVDKMGKICGMVAQADIALKGSDKITADVVESVSKPADRPAGK
jgi:CBS domain-containing protein